MTGMDLREEDAGVRLLLSNDVPLLQERVVVER